MFSCNTCKSNIDVPMMEGNKICTYDDIRNKVDAKLTVCKCQGWTLTGGY